MKNLHSKVYNQMNFQMDFHHINFPLICRKKPKGSQNMSNWRYILVNTNNSEDNSNLLSPFKFC